MRRQEFDSESDEDFQFITQNTIVGYLGLVDYNNYPRIIPLNFTNIGKDIYFHGAKLGEKYRLIQSNPKATFSADIPYSFIPSHFISEKYACPATHFFKSLHIRGIIKIEEDIAIKSQMLNVLMKKYQPEGRYMELKGDEKIYRNALEEVGVFKLKSSEITMKIKFGQNMSISQMSKVIQGLKNRNEELDKKTLKEIYLRYTSPLTELDKLED